MASAPNFCLISSRVCSAFPCRWTAEKAKLLWVCAVTMHIRGNANQAIFCFSENFAKVSLPLPDFLAV